MRTACLVEHHSDDYAAYLCSVFHDDPQFQAEARAWGAEELQHGRVLRRWAELADPDFDFDDRFARFAAGHVIPLDASHSVRGSRARELIARCIVEVGTSSFYSAVRDAAEEPVLKHICHRIAGDEYRHYQLFYRNLKRYRAAERPSVWQGLRRRWSGSRKPPTTKSPTPTFAETTSPDPTGGAGIRSHARAARCVTTSASMYARASR